MEFFYEFTQKNFILRKKGEKMKINADSTELK